MRTTTILAAAACVVLVLALVAQPAQADTAANCSFSDFMGHWTFQESAPDDNTIQCTLEPLVSKGVGVRFSYPNIAVDDNGNTGNFTLIYNQGIEAWVGGRIIFFFSAYDAQGNSNCTTSQIGWSHDIVDRNTNWKCISATRDSQSKDEFWSLYEESTPSPVAAEVEEVAAPVATKTQMLKEDGFKVAPKKKLTASSKYKADRKFLDAVNAAQSMFTVGEYPEFAEMTIGELQKRRGSSQGMIEASMPPTGGNFKAAAPSTQGPMPQNFDWRNISGVNYVSPVRNQQSCGSCYTFATTGMFEARIRVRSGNKLQPVLSTQEIVSCSEYSQGCHGGFNYLIGKYARDFGLVEDACYPYVGRDSTCSPNPQAGCSRARWYGSEYYYVGGYYGASNERVMQEELMAGGPMAVSFQVYDDFMHYKGGVYTHKFTKHLSEYNPFQQVSHAVLAVGWGTTDDGIPYWIVKNSWGPSWGEDGYFRIIRGSNDCAIESIAMAATPVLH